MVLHPQAKPGDPCAWDGDGTGAVGEADSDTVARGRSPSSSWSQDADGYTRCMRYQVYGHQGMCAWGTNGQVG